MSARRIREDSSGRSLSEQNSMVVNDQASVPAYVGRSGGSRSVRIDEGQTAPCTRLRRAENDALNETAKAELPNRRLHPGGNSP